MVLGTSEQISKSRHLFRDPVRYPRAGAGALKDRDGSEDEKDGEKPSEGAEETPDRIDD